MKQKLKSASGRGAGHLKAFFFLALYQRPRERQQSSNADFDQRSQNDGPTPNLRQVAVTLS